MGHVRRRHEQLRAGGVLRGRQPVRGRGGRGRRAVQFELRPPRLPVRVLEGDAAGDRLVGPEHGRPQPPDRLRPGDDGAGDGGRRQRTRHGRARRAAAVPDRPSGTDQRPGGNVVPKLGHHPVRRSRSHRHARDHRFGGHGAGVGRRRPARQLRAEAFRGRPASRRAAEAERAQAAPDDDRRGRRPVEHRRLGAPGSLAGRVGPALRLRAARPGARHAEDQRGQDPAAGPDHLARLVSRPSTWSARTGSPSTRISRPTAPSSRAASATTGGSSGRPASSRASPTSGPSRTARARTR